VISLTITSNVSVLAVGAGVAVRNSNVSVATSVSLVPSSASARISMATLPPLSRIVAAPSSPNVRFVVADRWRSESMAPRFCVPS